MYAVGSAVGSETVAVLRCSARRAAQTSTATSQRSPVLRNCAAKRGRVRQPTGSFGPRGSGGKGRALGPLNQSPLRPDSLRIAVDDAVPAARRDDRRGLGVPPRELVLVELVRPGGDACRPGGRPSRGRRRRARPGRGRGPRRRARWRGGDGPRARPSCPRPRGRSIAPGFLRVHETRWRLAGRPDRMATVDTRRRVAALLAHSRAGAGAGGLRGRRRGRPEAAPRRPAAGRGTAPPRRSRRRLPLRARPEGPRRPARVHRGLPGLGPPQRRAHPAGLRPDPTGGLRRPPRHEGRLRERAARAADGRGTIPTARSS